MCGIVGLFLKDPGLQPELGRMLQDMLVVMSDRGPDSAGFAIYGDIQAGLAKITIQAAEPAGAFAHLGADLSAFLGTDVGLQQRDTHAVLVVPRNQVDPARAWLPKNRPEIRVMGAGNCVEIYKEVGRPAEVAARFGMAAMTGTHGIGHTRMATESAVTTKGAHPFSTGPDQCLVHNGSLSNHNNLRRELIRKGMAFETDNDTEVAAGYLTWRMREGARLGEALQTCLADLDGFYTFVVGTEKGFGVLRDPIACKPAVLAETERYVAFGSEYRTLVGLPGIERAKVWEPEPGQVYFWEHA